MSQSKLDLSNDLTSSGAVNVTTRRGRTHIMVRHSDISATITLPPPTSRLRKDWKILLFNAASTGHWEENS